MQYSTSRRIVRVGDLSFYPSDTSSQANSNQEKLHSNHNTESTFTPFEEILRTCTPYKPK